MKDEATVLADGVVLRHVHICHVFSNLIPSQTTTSVATKGSSPASKGLSTTRKNFDLRTRRLAISVM